MLTAREVRNALGAGAADTVGKGKDGIIVRKGYFYRNGLDAETFKARVMARLMSEGLEPELCWTWAATFGSPFVGVQASPRAVTSTSS